MANAKPTVMTLELPAKMEIARGFRESDDVATVEIETAKLHANVRAALMEYGIRQKIGDKAASAENVKAAQSLLESVRDDLYNGVWKASRSGGGSDPMIAFRRAAVRQLARSNTALADKIKAHEAGSARNEYLDTVAADNESVIEPIAKQLFDEAQAVAKAAADAASDLAI